VTRGRRIAPGLYRRPGGTWGVLIGSGGRGEQKQIQRTFPDRAAAEDFLRAYRINRAHLSVGLPAPAGTERKKTLRQLWHEYDEELRKLGRSAAHRRNVSKAQRLSEDALSPECPVPLTREHLVTIAEHARRETETHGDAIIRTYRLLSAAHRRAELEMGRPPEITVERHGRRVLSPEDFRRFLSALPAGSCERVAVVLGYVTGCREAELFALRRSDVDLEAGAVTIRSHKTGGLARIVYLGAYTVELLRAWMPRIGPDGPLLTLDGTSPLGATSLRKRLQAASKAAGLAAVHSLGWLRNQAATAAVESGQGIDVASRALGHADPGTTRRHYDRAKLIDARRRFAEVREDEVKASG